MDKTMSQTNGDEMGMRMTCQRLLETWLRRDLKRLMQLSFVPLRADCTIQTKRSIKKETFF